jgi:hypothetical protein
MFERVETAQCTDTTYRFPNVAVGDIAFKERQRCRHWLRIREQMFPLSSQIRFEPVTGAFGPCGNVLNERVGWARDPKCCWLIIRFFAICPIVRYDRHRRSCLGTQISNKLVTNLHTIFKHKAMAFCVVRNVLFNTQLVRSVHNDTSLRRLSNSVLGNDRQGRVFTKMEMNWVSSQETLLPHISELDPLDTLRLVWCTMHHKVPTVPRYWIASSLNQDVP